jgi:hypothetical protein
MVDLIDELRKAERANMHRLDRPCSACDALAKIEDPETKRLLSDALAGTIGRDSLVAILRRHGHIITRRDLERHRSERHGQ